MVAGKWVHNLNVKDPKAACLPSHCKVLSLFFKIKILLMFPGEFILFLWLLADQDFDKQMNFHCSLTEAKPEQIIFISSGMWLKYFIMSSVVPIFH